MRVKRTAIDFDEIQKAMEDTVRDAFDYFLDLESGDVIIISEDIISKAMSIIEADFDEDLGQFEAVEFDREFDFPDWMEDEIELALNIFLHKASRYRRIPERDPARVFSAMKEFSEGLENREFGRKLLGLLDGKGAFRRFKDALEPHPLERKLWYGFSAKKAREEIMEWLEAREL
jgi:hypothetical protein